MNPTGMGAASMEGADQLPFFFFSSLYKGIGS